LFVFFAFLSKEINDPLIHTMILRLLTAILYLQYVYVSLYSPVI